MRLALTALSMLTAASGAGEYAYGASEPWSLPDREFTPGQVDRAVDSAAVCHDGSRSPRQVSDATRDWVLNEYRLSVNQRPGYVIDHLVPIEIGGSSGLANLWPEPADEAAVKDSCEIVVRRMVCLGTLTLADGQNLFLGQNWPSSCRLYLGR